MGSVYQPSSFAADDSRYEHAEDATPKATGNKRLFSNRQSRQLDPEDVNYTHYNTLLRNTSSREPSETRRHSDKRYRNEDWPLTSSQPPSPSTSSRPPLRSRHAPNSPNSRRRAISAQRPSKFVEGSMNDRVSNMPPTPYLDDDDDDLLYEYDAIEPSRGRKLARTRKFTGKRNPSTAGASVTSQNNENAPGGRNSIYKFGKSIAATFNPSNWKIWSKPQPFAEETAQMKLLRERQSQAERIYRELKESGQFRDSAIVFPNQYIHVQEQVAKPKHDSGVEMENESIKNGSVRKTREMSVEEKRMGRVFLEPPPPLAASIGESPVSHISSSQAHSNNVSPNKGVHFKKPSLSNLKRTLAGNSSTNLSEIGQEARRIPSRKDLQKQQRLVKRVSDLEGKLQSARQQLSVALGQPLPDGASQVSLFSQSSRVSHAPEESTDAPVPPMHQTATEKVMRKRFVPGALASLPSERLLSGYTDNDEAEEDNGIGRAVSVDTRSHEDQNWSKGGLRNNASPAWLGEPLHRHRSLSRDRPLSSVERDDDATPMVKNPFISTRSEIATTISEPTTRDEGPKDGEYVEDVEPAAVSKEQLDKTPKLASKQSPSPKLRKKKFMGLADDGGVYVPEETTEESDPESEVKKLPTPRRQKPSATSTPGSKQADPPRKLQKVSPNRAKNPSTNGPPTRAPPPPPVSTQSPPNKHPARTSSLKATMKSPPPSKRLSKPPPMPTGSQQSSSPPPSSSFAGLPDLQYKKPSSQRRNPRNAMNDTQLRTFADEGSDLEYSAHPQDEGVPAMPALPASIQGLRLSSGEVLMTTAQKFENTPPSSLDKRRGKSRGGSVLSNSATSKVTKASGKVTKERKESKRLEKKKESLSAALEEQNAEGKYEWPEDLEVF